MTDKTEKKGRSNEMRRIWDVIPEKGITLDGLCMLFPERSRHALHLTCGRLKKGGYIRSQAGLVEENARFVTFFRTSKEAPKTTRTYKTNIATRARKDGHSTIALMDNIETKFLTLQEELGQLSSLIDQIRDRLITDAIVDELTELRRMKADVEGLVRRKSNG